MTDIALLPLPGRVARTCEACGSGFDVKRNVVLGGGGRWCSKSCARRGSATVDPQAFICARVEIDGATECWNWRGCTRNGYGQSVWRGNSVRSHRLAFEAFRGAIPPGMHVCHHCDNRRCCNPTHLFVGTNADNVADKVRKGRVVVPRGEESRFAKLRAADVITIRSDTRAARLIAAERGVSTVLIHKIRQRRLWRHLP